MRLISVDTETTGVDFNHGARPFLVTTCDDKNVTRFWEWRVDPLTRQPIIPPEDIDAIHQLLDQPDQEFVLQNTNFDVVALGTIDPRFKANWPWERTNDTLLAGHLLASNSKHNLTDMLWDYKRINIQPFEDAVKRCTEECRAIARKQFPNWLIAKEGLACMPSVKGSSKRDEDKPWKNDMWLPREVAFALNLPLKHEYWTVTQRYANVDSSATILLWYEQKKLIAERGYSKVFSIRPKLLPIELSIETRGVTLSARGLNALDYRYHAESTQAAHKCVDYAKRRGFELHLPKGASPNNSLRDFILNHLKLPPYYSKKSKTGDPSLSKEAFEYWEAQLPPEDDRLQFIQTLKGKRSRDTARSYMAGYKRFWIPTGILNSFGEQLWYRLFPSLNPTGTHTLRWSSSNPNAQNISKKESFNLRYPFGPMPGREWWSMDGKNLELRIPTFEAKEEALMRVFNHPNDPPYYGSYHLVVFDVLHPELFAKHGKKVKDLFESTWYQWVKNGNFAVIYGAQEKTADLSYHVPGAFAKISSRFPAIAALNEWYKDFARAHGFVETIPDRSVDPERGYPLVVSRSEDGSVMPTTPFNYHVSGTAMWWTNMAMIRCEEQIKEWNRQGWDGFMTLQVHDELVFDVPRGTGPEPWKTNLPRMRKLQHLMELGGTYIGVPTPVSIEYHAETWATGMAL